MEANYTLVSAANRLKELIILFNPSETISSISYPLLGSTGRVTKSSSHEGTKMARGLEHMDCDLKMVKTEADNLGEGRGDGDLTFSLQQCKGWQYISESERLFRSCTAKKGNS